MSIDLGSQLHIRFDYIMHDCTDIDMYVIGNSKVTTYNEYYGIRNNINYHTSIISCVIGGF